MRTNTKLNQLTTASWRYKSVQHWWEASALNTAPYLLPSAITVVLGRSLQIKENHRMAHDGLSCHPVGMTMSACHFILGSKSLSTTYMYCKRKYLKQILET